MNTAPDGIIIKKAENIDTAGYKKIPHLMQLVSDVLNPKKITLNHKFPALECEMDTLAFSAKITQKKKQNKKPKTLKDRLNEINENTDIQKTILQAEENGELNATAKSKIPGLLKKQDYINLPNEGRKEVISKWLSFYSQNDDPFNELLTFTSLKYNLNKKSIEISVNIIIKIIKNLSNKLDTVKPSYLSTEQSKQLLQELNTLQDKIKTFINKCGDVNE